MARDPRIEAQLNQLVVDYHYNPSIIRTHIDRKWSQEQLQTRLLTPQINPDTVESFKLQMRAGADFPAVVLWPIPGRGVVYGIVSGNHRVAAAEAAGRVTIDAYVLDTEDRAVVDTVARLANVIEAPEGAPRVERIAQAQMLMDRHGWTRQAAAAAVGVTAELLEDVFRQTRTRERLTYLGVRAANISPSTLAVMAAIQSDAPLRAMGQLVVDARLGQSSTQALVKEVRKARSEQEAIALIEQRRRALDIRERLDGVRKGRSMKVRVVHPGARLTKLLHEVKALMEEHPTWESLDAATPAAQKDLRALVLRVCVQLEGLNAQHTLDGAGSYPSAVVS
jgi:ParB-like chromosome segregation protein Spo0J